MPRILFVEDNDMNRDMLSRRLIRNGYEVSLAVDGQQGADKALSEQPDLILMDMSLPVTDGWEATRRIKADPALRAIPIIAITSYGLSGDEEKARAAGCDDFVPKPYRPTPITGENSQLLAVVVDVDCCNALRLPLALNGHRMRTDRWLILG